MSTIKEKLTKKIYITIELPFVVWLAAMLLILVVQLFLIREYYYFLVQ